MRPALFVSCVLMFIACSSNGLSTNNDLGDHLGEDLASTSNDLGDHEDCSQWTDDSSCSANGCTPLDCPGCGLTEFMGCYAPGTPLPECVAPPCVVPECSTLTTQTACGANPECVALFTQALCNCASPDCCPMVFESCTLGPVECAPTGGTGSCPFAPPCNTGYLPAYGAQGCEIGCVESTVCAG